MSRTIRGATDLLRFGALFATSSSFRAAVHRARLDVGERARETTQMTLETSRASVGARVHRRLSGAALAFAGVQAVPAPRRVNLVLNEFDPVRLFAGVSTALDVAVAIATESGAELRLLTLSERLTRETGVAAAEALVARGAPMEVVTRTEIADAEFGEDDVWIVTHWTTAHPVQVAVDDGRIRADRVVYLVQDFEPGFAGWSTPSAVARDTYEAGFHLLVNSRPLWRYLVDRVGLDIPESRVFAPALATARLDRVADRSADEGRVRVFFYGRPGKPRNLFDLGLAALEHAALRLGDRAARVEFLSAGEPHPDVLLTETATVRSVGTLGWEEYFDLLARTDVALSLQASPHPSHPPLEAAIAGAISVTNEFEQTRGDLHPRLRAVEAHPRMLGDAVVAAIEHTWNAGRGTFAPPVGDALGRPLADVVRDLLTELPGLSRRT